MTLKDELEAFFENRPAVVQSFFETVEEATGGLIPANPNAPSSTEQLEGLLGGAGEGALVGQAAGQQPQPQGPTPAQAQTGAALLTGPNAAQQTAAGGLLTAASRPEQFQAAGDLVKATNALSQIEEAEVQEPFPGAGTTAPSDFFAFSGDVGLRDSEKGEVFKQTKGSFSKTQSNKKTPDQIIDMLKPFASAPSAKKTIEAMLAIKASEGKILKTNLEVDNIKSQIAERNQLIKSRKDLAPEVAREMKLKNEVQEMELKEKESLMKTNRTILENKAINSGLDIKIKKAGIRDLEDKDAPRSVEGEIRRLLSRGQTTGNIVKEETSVSPFSAGTALIEGALNALGIDTFLSGIGDEEAFRFLSETDEGRGVLTTLEKRLGFKPTLVEVQKAMKRIRAKR